MGEARWLYCSDWYDGPMAGMVEIDGRQLWAEYVREDLDGGREYAVYQMPDDWMAEEADRHALWLECSGNYSWDKPEGWAGPTRPVDEFYRQYPPRSRDTRPAGRVLFGVLSEHEILAGVRRG